MPMILALHAATFTSSTLSSMSSVWVRLWHCQLLTDFPDLEPRGPIARSTASEMLISLDEQPLRAGRGPSVKAYALRASRGFQAGDILETLVEGIPIVKYSA